MIILCCIILPGRVWAQDDDELIDPVLIYLKARLVDADDGSPVSYAHIVNMRTRGGTTTDVNGYFSLEMLNVDSLGLSAMGYMRDFVHIPYSYNPDSVLRVYARPLRVAIGEVKVTGEGKKVNMDGVGTGKPSDLDPTLRGDAFNKKPSVLAAIFSPASFLQYHLSKREKEKRNVRAAMISDAQWQRLSKYYNKDVVMAITGLTYAEADTFMIYFNQKNVLTAHSNEYDVRDAILKQYLLYQQEQFDGAAELKPE
ncbi:carboxypeptidase-like regulatory domain-containing protein [Mangrovibacterium marinum]|uniref:carboxypeptidase-like regulatory domain-containing protein n=1 Tax=Mangrovibacterium marinum TaxID=1639118 RepID=UPI0011B21A6B|nr:carboxypeptidase-like regulatory domain-containing protein [Mangrovibacterium marinum]